MNSLSTALTTIRRSPYQALTSIMMVAVTFFVGFALSLSLIGANEILNYFETRPQIIAFFEIDADSSTIQAVADNMEQKPYVEGVKVVTQEEALEIYQQTNQEEPLLLELVTADILPASIEVSADSIDSLSRIKSDLEQAPGIEDVSFQETVVNQISQWTQNLRLIGTSVMIVLGTISFLIIMVVTAMKAVAQRKSISIMRIIGATRGYIKRPFVLEGMIYGLAGSVIGWLGMYAALLYLTPEIQAFLGEITLLPVPTEVLLTQLAIGAGTGILLGGFAGWVAVTHLIKR